MTRPWSRLLLAILLAAGFAVAWGFPVGWLAALIAETQARGAVYEQLLFKPDGTPVITWWDQTSVRHYRDVRGQDLDIPDDQPWLNGANLYASGSPRSIDPVDWNLRIRSFQDNRRPPVYWYFIAGRPGEGSAYFVGYDSVTALGVGYLGTAGFRETQPTPEESFAFTAANGRDTGNRLLSSQTRFGVGAGEPRAVYYGGPPLREGRLAPAHVYVIDDAGKVWLVDVHARRSSLVFEQEPVVSAGTIWFDSRDRDAGHVRIALRTDKAVVIMSPRNEVLSRVPIPEALRGQDLYLAETTQGDMVVQYNLPQDPREDVHRYVLVRLDRAGRIQSEKEVDLRGRAAWPAQRTALALIMPAALPVGASVAGILAPQALTVWPGGYLAALREAAVYFAPSILVATLIGIALAVWTYRREVRYGSARIGRILWPLFALLFGLPGWIGYRYSRAWPVLEACPACGRPAPRDRLACQSCQAEFPAPALLGTEVFA
jgi:hypothetical protein